MAEAANTVSRELAALNLEQLNEGKKASGQNMRNYVQGSKSPSAPGRVILKDTGSFQAGFYTFATPDAITFDSTDPKADILNSRFDYNPVFGLDDERIRQAQNIISQQYVMIVNRKIAT